MKRSMALTMALMLVLSGLLLVTDAWARVGGGGSSGSRGSRSYSAPAKPSPSQVSPSRPTTPPPSTPAPPPAPQRGWGSMFGGMLGGLLIGGLLGSLLFGGMGHGLFGGIGLLEIALIGVLAFLAIRFMRSRQAQPAAPGGYATAGGYGGGAWRDTSASYGGTQTQAQTQTVEAPAPASDVDRGVDNIRQMDAGFDSLRFAEEASDSFFKIQSAWTARDVGRVAALLTPEMLDTLQRDCDRLRAERRINRLENIAVRHASVTEAWQERGQDFATVHFVASLLDYTTDERGTVVDGSAIDPVKFEEYWTFVRPVGPNAWKLSAIQQPS